jgi:uncharacterized protein YceK
MSTSLQKKHSDLGKMILTVLVVFIILMIAIAVSGCSSTAVKADPKASSAAQPTQEPTKDANMNIHAFGETASFDDGLSLSMSLPSAYTPTEEAAGIEPGQTVLAFEFVVTNNSKEPFDPSTVLATASSAGTEASGVFDNSNNVGFPPMTAVLPGQTVKWVQAWSVTDINSVNVEVGVGFNHDAQVFTNTK